MMNKERHYFTSESVTEGHPDKMCDQISDGILDAILSSDKGARVACETIVCTGLALVMGEITTTTYVDIPSIVRQVIEEIGYTRGKYGFDAENCAVLTSINEQSADIAMGVNAALELKESSDKETADDWLGAGDQGMMFGFACNETPELMPAPIQYAHQLTRRLAAVRKAGLLPWLRPDGKSQVTVEYEGNIPVRIATVVLSTQHAPDVSQEEIRREILQQVIIPALPAHLLDEKTRYLINPTGRFVIGGPHGDSGLTGRKIIVDTYGGMASHGGGAFSGKDPTKVDRSAAYMARYIAKNIVAAGLADRCELQLAYAIGVAQPVSVMLNTFGTGKLAEDQLVKLVRQYFDMRPAAIINRLNLRRPIYRQVACYGHFGRSDLDLSWEKTDMAQILANAALKISASAE